MENFKHLNPKIKLYLSYLSSFVKSDINLIYLYTSTPKHKSYLTRAKKHKRNFKT